MKYRGFAHSIIDKVNIECDYLTKFPLQRVTSFLCPALPYINRTAQFDKTKVQIEPAYPGEEQDIKIAFGSIVAQISKKKCVSETFVCKERGRGDRRLLIMCSLSTVTDLVDAYIASAYTPHKYQSTNISYDPISVFIR